MSILIADKYIITKKIGEGSFGNIYQGYHKETNENIAIKIEHTSNKCLLQHEADIYSILNDISNIPKMRTFGNEGQFTYIVMDLLNVSLDSIRLKNNGYFSLKTILMLGHELITIIENIHNCNIIHRDIKPENFMIGRNKLFFNNPNKIFIIDFGLAKEYKTDNTHIPFKNGKYMIGTSRYASINVHKGIEYSRRDDLESIGYMLLYLFTGKLPWQGLNISNTKHKNKKICKLKQELTTMDYYAKLPDALKHFLEYVKKLHFTNKPDYKYIKNIFLNEMKLNHFYFDNKYDWLKSI